ncbi:hypothetical protein D3C72_1839450 [compost metagenome]
MIQLNGQDRGHASACKHRKPERHHYEVPRLESVDRHHAQKRHRREDEEHQPRHRPTEQTHQVLKLGRLLELQNLWRVRRRHKYGLGGHQEAQRDGTQVDGRA